MDAVFSGVPGVAGTKIRSLADRKRCTIATPKLILARRQVLGFLVSDDRISGCISRVKCYEERFRWLKTECDDTDEFIIFDPLFKEFHWKDYSVCPFCLANARESFPGYATPS
jgi:hypothetical protein